MLVLAGCFFDHGRYESIERLQVGLKALMGQHSQHFKVILKSRLSDLDLLQDPDELTQRSHLDLLILLCSPTLCLGQVGKMVERLVWLS